MIVLGCEILFGK